MSTFKLINFLEDTRFNGLRFSMGAKLVQPFSNNKLTLLDEEAFKKLGKEGIDIDDLSDIQKLPDGTLGYKGKRVIVYIRDVKQYNADQSLPVFHFAYCKTLDYMQTNKRWHRYVAANRDTGDFLINFIGSGYSKPATIRLRVCQNCLSFIRWQDFDYSMPYNKKNEIVQNFTLDNFFKVYPKDFLSVAPTHTVDTAPLNDYSDDWGFISESFKQKHGYTCSECNLNLSSDKAYLHVHHINGEKNNNSEENLRVLCIKCHSDQEMHGHMKNHKDLSEFMSKYGERF